VEIRAEVEVGGAHEVGLTLGPVPQVRGTTEIAYDHEAGRLRCAERSGRFRLLPGEERLTLRIFLDRSVVEVYANGRVALTAREEYSEAGEDGDPREAARSLALFTRGGEARAPAVDAWDMASIWGAPTA
jgi:beta-fructofuranosidase